MKPCRLKKNDIIGIVSPSDPVTVGMLARFREGIKFLENLGFEVEVAGNALENSLGYSASPEEKAEDINNMFQNPAVKAVICSTGGSTANICLPYLDWEIISSNPKIFMGISDITVLLNAINRKTGLITFHGNDIIWGFGSDPQLYDIREFAERLIEGRSGPVNSNGKRKTIRGGTARGRLIGGNLTCLLKLAGTPYFPDPEGAVLFIESFGFSPEKSHCCFAQLEQLGVFNQIKGLVVGYIYDEDEKKRSIHLEDILKRVTEKYQLPILKVNDFGHVCPNTVLPVGARIKIDADKQEIEILEDFLV